MTHADGGLGRLTQWVLALAASGVLWSGIAAPTSEAQAQGSPPAPLPKAVGTFTYWGGLIFSEEANAMLVQRIKQWGKERGVPVDVVMINQNETVQRVSAAVEAGTMPDAHHERDQHNGRLGHQPQGLRRQALRRAIRDVGQSPESA